MRARHSGIVLVPLAPADDDVPTRFQHLADTRSSTTPRRPPQQPQASKTTPTAAAGLAHCFDATISGISGDVARGPLRVH